MKYQTEHIGPSFDEILFPTSKDGSYLNNRLLDMGNSKKLCYFPSGRAAIYYALHQADISSEDEVLLPSYSCYAVQSAVEAVAEPIYVDVKSTNYMLDLEDAKSKTTNATKAIIPIHLFGDFCDMKEVATFAEDHNLLILEDACQALGTATISDAIGEYSDYCCFSFSYYKDITSYAGGVLLANNEQLKVPNPLTKQDWKSNLILITLIDEFINNIPGRFYEPLRSQLLDPISRRQSGDLGPTSPCLFSSWVHSILGNQLAHLPQRVKRRRENAAIYDETLPSSFELPRRTNSHSYFRYPILLPEEIRDEFCASLRRKGIGCSTMYSYSLDSKKNSPVASDVANRILNLPVHSGIAKTEIHDISSLASKIWSEYE